MHKYFRVVQKTDDSVVDLASGVPFFSWCFPSPFLFVNRRAAIHARPSIGLPKKEKK